VRTPDPSEAFFIKSVKRQVSQPDFPVKPANSTLVALASDLGRSAINSSTLRRLSENRRYQRTHVTMISSILHDVKVGEMNHFFNLEDQRGYRTPIASMRIR